MRRQPPTKQVSWFEILLAFLHARVELFELLLRKSALIKEEEQAHCELHARFAGSVRPTVAATIPTTNPALASPLRPKPLVLSAVLLPTICQGKTPT
jgi:hypothetical protein